MILTRGGEEIPAIPPREPTLCEECVFLVNFLRHELEMTQTTRTSLIICCRMTHIFPINSVNRYVIRYFGMISAIGVRAERDFGTESLMRILHLMKLRKEEMITLELTARRISMFVYVY